MCIGERAEGERKEKVEEYNKEWRAGGRTE